MYESDNVLASYIDTKDNQLMQIQYAMDPENPVDNTDSDYRYYIMELITRQPGHAIAAEIFNNNYSRYLKVHNQYDNEHDLFNALKSIALKQNKLILPIGEYRHSDVHYSIGTPNGFDSSTCGFLVVDLHDRKPDDPEIQKVIDSDLDDLSDYANGYIYDIVISNLDDRGEIADAVVSADNIPASEMDYQDLSSIAKIIDIRPEDWQDADTEIQVFYKPTDRD